MISLLEGNVSLREEDFHLGGHFPLVWKRAYESMVDIEGSYGSKWRHSFEQSILLDPVLDEIEWTNEKAGSYTYEGLPIGGEEYFPQEKVYIRRFKGRFEVENYTTDIIHHFEQTKNAPNHFRLHKVSYHQFEITCLLRPMEWQTHQDTRLHWQDTTPKL